MYYPKRGAFCKGNYDCQQTLTCNQNRTQAYK